jgi:hypothetical protein
LVFFTTRSNAQCLTDHQLSSPNLEVNLFFV